ncbi:MAG: hypothetical protein ACQBVK_02785, partial [Candidatus Phytoplasma sp. TWB_XP]
QEKQAHKNTKITLEEKISELKSQLSVFKSDSDKLDDASITWQNTVDSTTTAINIGGATYSGAIMGSALGPWGTAIGGFLGGTIGGVTAVATKWDTVKKWWPW